LEDVRNHFQKDEALSAPFLLHLFETNFLLVPYLGMAEFWEKDISYKKKGSSYIQN